MLGLTVNDADALPLYVVRPAALEAFLSGLPSAQAGQLRAHRFEAAARQVCLLAGDGGLAGAVVGLGEERGPYVFGDLASVLPPSSVWRFVPGDYDGDDAALGFLLGSYAYEHFKPRKRAPALLSSAQVASRTVAIAEAVCFARDLINTPPNILGPVELARAAVGMAAEFGVKAEIISDSVLQNRYPALAAVAAGSERPGQVALFEWQGSKATAQSPLISLCGKGVCFDTGGYDLKPSAAMLRMKKDMGGAAILLGLAKLIMASDLSIRLQVRIGCVENSISGRAMRPSDVLQTHAGKTVEVGNTDAEGRLVLCDLLAEAAIEKPDWLIDAATLTGAARVALGPDLPAMFCNNDKLANALLTGGEIAHDPLWRLPLWAGYDTWLDSNVADMNTVSAKPFAGAIVAALFLQRFVPKDVAWAHIDVYSWNDQTRPGRPEGGEAQSLRALFSAIENFNSY
ncbi:MAG: leucyl aminopeptidase [Acidocella sp. 20-58-15]|nr:MAG: leucyl aminopeptidase [Acidocella sp. 20-58-15]